MRREVLFAASLLVACFYEVGDPQKSGVYPCRNSGDCLEGFRCVSGFCSTGAGGGDAAGGDPGGDLDPGDPNPCGNYPHYRDRDGDGTGDAASAVTDCIAAAPPGYANDNTDCDDSSAACQETSECAAADPQVVPRTAPSGTSPNTSPALAADAARFLLAWNARNAGSDADVRYAWSTDGVSFADAGFAEADNTADADGPPAVATNGKGRFVLAWASPDLGGTAGADGDLAYVTFEQDGTTPEGVKALEAVATADTSVEDQPALAYADGRFLAVWRTDAGQDSAIAAAYLLDDATSWSTTVDVSEQATNSDDDSDPAVAGAPGGGFVVAWTRSTANGARVYAAHSSDGAVFGSATLLHTLSAGKSADQPVVAALPDQSFMVVWRANPGSSQDIYFSTYDGNSWTNPAAVSNATDDEAEPSIASDGYGRVIVGFTANRGGIGTGLDVRYAYRSPTLAFTAADLDAVGLQDSTSTAAVSNGRGGWLVAWSVASTTSTNLGIASFTACGDLQ